MTSDLDQALKQVIDILQKEAHEHCVSATIFFNSEGYEISYNMRSPESLKRSGISMRNINGDFIRCQ